MNDLDGRLRAARKWIGAGGVRPPSRLAVSAILLGVASVTLMLLDVQEDAMKYTARFAGGLLSIAALRDFGGSRGVHSGAWSLRVTWRGIVTVMVGVSIVVLGALWLLGYAYG